MRADDAVRCGVARLEAAGIEAARREARMLLAETAGLTMAQLLADPGRTIDPAPFEALVARRARREPMALVLGWAEFWSFRVRVSGDTLIPRADSETLIEAAVASGRPVERVLDLGTGTGCLLLAALTEFSGSWGVGVDMSAATARLALENARALGLAERCRFVCADWGAALAPGRFDLVLCNPPYVRRGDIAGLMPEVARHEPARALDGGQDGLDAYRQVVPTLPRLLAPGGVAVLELGQGQAPGVTTLADRAGLHVVALRPDLSGILRALVLESGKF